MFIDHFYFQFLLKQKVSLDPVQNGGGVHVLCPRNRSKWLANPELVPDFVTKTIILLDNVYWHLVYCSFLLLNFLFFGGGQEPGPLQGVHGPGPYKWSIDPIENGGSMAHDWNLRKGKINQWWWMMNESRWTSTVDALHRLHLTYWPFSHSSKRY